jgi:hypothetical protein
VKDCLRPQNLPEDLQHWFLMDAHLRFLAQRFGQSIQALDEKLEQLRVTRPPFFQVKTRQLAVTEEHKVASQALSVQADAKRVREAMEKMDRIIVGKMSKMILALDPESARDAAEILDTIRKFARVNWLDEEQNDQAFPYIIEELDKVTAPPPETPVIAPVYGATEHPKDVPRGDPWANAAD